MRNDYKKHRETQNYSTPTIGHNNTTWCIHDFDRVLIEWLQKCRPFKESVYAKFWSLLSSTTS